MILIRGSKWWNVQVACLVGKHQTPLRDLAIGSYRSFDFTYRLSEEVPFCHARDKSRESNLPKSCMRAFNGNNLKNYALARG